MSCEIYRVPKGASAGRNHCAGRVDNDGSVYDVPSGVSAGRNHCVGHIESDGNVYNVPWGASAGISHCVGHVDSSGNVYRTPKGASAGVSSCVGHVEGGNSRQGAAALLLLLNHGGGSSGTGGGGKASFLGDFPGLVVFGIFIVVLLFGQLISGAYNVELLAIGFVALVAVAGAWIGSRVRKARDGGHTSYKPPKKTYTPPKKAYTPPKKTQTPPKKTDNQPKQTYAFFTCGSCGQKVRVPAGKGRIQIICPKCGNRFNVST